MTSPVGAGAGSSGRWVLTANPTRGSQGGMHEMNTSVMIAEAKVMTASVTANITAVSCDDPGHIVSHHVMS